MASTSRCSPACSASWGSQRSRQTRLPVGARQVRFVVFPGSALFKKQPAADHERGARRDESPVRADERGHRSGLGRADRGRPGQAHLRRAALGEEAGLGRRLRARHALRGADRREPARSVRSHRCRVGARPLHPLRARRRRVGHRPHRQATVAVRPRQPGAARPNSRSSRSAARRRDILYDDEAIFDFYNARIPADVATTRSLRDLVAQRDRRTVPTC